MKSIDRQDMIVLRRVIAIIVISVVIFAGCHSSAKQSHEIVATATIPAPIISSTIPSTLSRTSPPIIPTKLKPSSTPSITPTPETTGTPIPLTATRTSTLAATLTPLPAISTQGAKDVLERFVQENGGCQLPCVMGLTPGKSDTIAFDAFIGYFQQNAVESNDQINAVDISSNVDDEWGGVGLNFWENRIRVDVIMDYYFDGNELKQIVLSTGVYQHFGEPPGDSARTLYEHPYYAKLARQFTLPNILITYGPPQQIWIRPFPDREGYPSPPAKYPFDFILFYPEQGFLVEYISVREEADGYFIGCPTRSHIDLSAWDPRETLSLKDAVRYFSNNNGIFDTTVNSLKPLRETTSLSIDNFYEDYKDSSSYKCVQTLKELWPLVE